MPIDPEELEQHLADMADDVFQDLVEKVRPPAGSSLRKGHDLYVATHPKRDRPTIKTFLG